MRKTKSPSILTAPPGEIPLFIRSMTLAEILGLTRECVYWRVTQGRLPPYDIDIGRTKGWSRSTLDENQPALMRIIREFYATRRVAP